MTDFVTRLPWLKIGKFTLINLTAFVPNIGLALVLMFMGVQYLIATMCGVAVHVVILFFSNRRWTFRRPDIRADVGLCKSALIEIVIIGVMLMTLYALVEYVVLAPELARVVSSVPSGILGWILYASVVFEDHPFRK